MATGILGQASLAANTNTAVYTVPAAVVATFNISIVNASSVGGTVSVALAATSTPSASEYIEFNTVLPANGVLERTGIVMDTTKKVVVNSSVAGVSVSVYGYEA